MLSINAFLFGFLLLRAPITLILKYFCINKYSQRVANFIIILVKMLSVTAFRLP